MTDSFSSTVIKMCSKSGFGQVIHRNKSFLVKGCYPQEEIEYTLSKNKKNLENINITKPISNRIESSCSHYDYCGGCPLLTLDITSQLEFKQSVIQKLFSEDIEKIDPIQINPAPYHYRNKVELTFSQNLEGDKKLGFHRFGSRGFAFDLSECRLIPSWMIEAKKFVFELFVKYNYEAFYLPKLQGNLKNLILRSNKHCDELLIALVVQDKTQLQDDFIAEFSSGLIKIFSDKKKVVCYLVEQQQKKGIPTKLSVTPLTEDKFISEPMIFNIENKTIQLTFQINPLSFFQPNFYTAQIIYQKAVEFLNLTPEDVVIDLYCGSGTFGMLASNFAKKVIGIEVHPLAVEDGRKLLIENKIVNMEFLLGDAKSKIQDVLEEKPNKIILDPPRAGLDPDVILTLKQINPEIIVYISCNPITQKRDVDELKKIGFNVEKILPVDQFTHTPHIENICVLKRPTCFM